MSLLDVISIGGQGRGARAGRERGTADTVDVAGFADCRARVLDAEGAAGFEGEWRALGRRSLEPNFCYEPEFALAAARHLGDAGQLRFIFVWQTGIGSTSDQKLVGCFPVLLPEAGLTGSVLRLWTHPQVSTGAPLVDRDAAAFALDAFLALAAGLRAAPLAVLFPRLPAESRFAHLLQAALARQNLAATEMGRYERAALRLDDETDRGLSSKKRKELRRQHRRLAEQGELLEESLRDPHDVRQAVERFMALEANGWKGQAGSAFIQDVGRAAFLRAATRAFAAAGQLSVESLAVDGQPVALGLLVRQGTRAWFWKIAYDEAFAAYSPGVLLTLALAERARAEGVELIDSCAIGDHPMIDHLWRDRIAVADVLAPLSPRTRLRYGIVRAREIARRNLRARVKQAVYKLQGRTAS